MLDWLNKRRGGDKPEEDEPNPAPPEEATAEETSAEETSTEEPTTEDASAETELPLDDEIAMSDHAINAEANIGLEETLTGVTRPVRPSLEETAISKDGLTSPSEFSRRRWLQSAQRCDIGRIRKRNEDSTHVFEAVSGGQTPLLDFGLYVVADGMGGHHAGHEASRTASRLVARAVLDKLYLPLLHSTDGDGPSGPPAPIGSVMQEAVQSANKDIHSDLPNQDSGTTLTAVLVFGRRLYIVHVGDSRAYLSTKDGLKQLTTDHSYVRRLMDAGQLTEEEAASHPQRNMLYRAVGQGGELDIDTVTQPLPERGRLLLCSDGLWGLVPDDVIQSVLQRSAGIQQAADALIDLALDAGGHDNISAIVVDFYIPPDLD